MNKPQFQFYFSDEPHRAVNEPREHVAHLLRAYRKQRRSFEVCRIAAHFYTVRLLHSPSGAVAVIAA